jgi:type II secretory pathway component GspD/PulD (secretin)
MKLSAAILKAVLLSAFATTFAIGQTTPAAKPDEKPATEKPAQDESSARVMTPRDFGRMDPRPVKTFYLANASQPNDGNEILTALRLLLDPSVKLYLTPTDNSITIRGSAEQIAQAQNLIAELDRPKKLFRLTYTVTESDSGKRIGVQHFSMILTAGQRTTLKMGSKVPVATGSYDEGKNGAQTQFTYLDIGMNFDATLQPVANGVSLSSKVEQSSVAEEKSGFGPQDPIVRQAVLTGTAELALNKPLLLGSLDVPGSTRHLDVEAVVELVH